MVAAASNSRFRHTRSQTRAPRPGYARSGEEDGGLQPLRAAGQPARTDTSGTGHVGARRRQSAFLYSPRGRAPRPAAGGWRGRRRSSRSPPASRASSASSARSSRAYYFGAAGKINAFTVAFQVPNLVRSLVADAALSSAFVPVFSELLEKGERKRAWRVASSLFWLMLLGLGGADRALDRARAARDRALRRPGRRQAARGRALARALPDRRAARRLRRRSSGSSTATTTSPSRR